MAYTTGMTLASRSLIPICSKTFLSPLRVASLLSSPEKSSTTFFRRHQIHHLFSTSTTPLFAPVKCSTLETECQAVSRPNVVDILQERGLLESVTSENLRSACSDPNVAPLKVYCGFDPTAESLHLGNLLGIIVLSWFQRCGHQAVGLIGGATGRVGDPSGKSLERPELDTLTLEKNIAGIKTILVKILGGNSTSTSSYVIFNNYDWWKDMTMLDFLKNVGRFARVGSMMAKESVKKRLESEQGMSYTEFSYQLLQGYDFVHLFDKDGVNVQIGGSDQWGNITAGTDLIWTILHREEAAYGLTLRELQRIYQLAHCLLIESLVFLLWISIVDMLVSAGLFESKSAARRMLKQGGVYMNNERVDDENKRVEEDDIVEGKGLVLSSVKKNKVVVRIS